MNQRLLIAAVGLVMTSVFQAQESNTAATHQNDVRVARMKPTLVTQPVETDADDPAIWINSKDPSMSRIIATDKSESPAGGLFVFDLDGRIVQRLADVNKPNNVDVEYGFSLGSKTIDVAVATERITSKLRIFSIQSDGTLTDIGGETSVFDGQTGPAKEPMGIGLYKRASDSRFFAIVSRKTGPSGSYLWQYELVHNNGKIDLKKVREFGQFSGKGEIEAVFVDDETNRVYYADEGYGVRIGIANPDDPSAAKDLGAITTEKFEGDREGIAVINQGPGKGYLLVTEQIPGASKIYVYPRTPSSGTKALVAIIDGADSTDGLDSATANFGTLFPRGMVVAMNSSGKNFFLYDIRQVLRTIPNK